MQPVGSCTVGTHIKHFVFKLVELRNFYIWSEHRNHYCNGIALVKQEILLKHIETIAHSGSRAFNGKQIEHIVGRRIPGTNCPVKILARYPLRIVKNTWRGGVVVAHYSASPFLD